MSDHQLLELAAKKALEAIESVLADAYYRGFPECCGRLGDECCGNPNAAWTPEDNKIMDVLSPVQRQLSEVLRTTLADQTTKQEPLTDDEIDVLWEKQKIKPFKTYATDRRAFARAIERAHGIGEQE